MTTTERVEALHRLYLQLDELITADEMETYPVLQHLEDLISDLEMEAEQ
jgi:hypothetical protein